LTQPRFVPTGCLEANVHLPSVLCLPGHGFRYIKQDVGNETELQCQTSLQSPLASIPSSSPTDKNNSNGLSSRNNDNMAQPNGGKNHPNGGKNHPNGGKNHPNDDRVNHPDGDGNDHSFEHEHYMVYWVEHALPPPVQRPSHFIFVDSRFVPMAPGQLGDQGTKFHVTGSMSTPAAMTFRVELCKHPRTSDPKCWFEHIGWVRRENFNRRITAVCDTIPPPPRQSKGTTPLSPGQPLRTCREWASDVKDQLVRTGVLEPLRAIDQGGDPKPIARN